MEELKKEVAITQEDYYRFNITFYKTRKSIRKIVCIWFPLFLSLIVFVMSFVKPPLDESISFKIFMTVFVFIIMGVACNLAYFLSRPLFRLYLKSVCKRVYKKNKDIGRPAIVTINDSGIETVGEGTKSFVTWSRIIKTIENEEAYYLFYAKTAAFFVPKRYLESMEETVFLQNLIEKKIDAKSISYIPLK